MSTPLAAATGRDRPALVAATALATVVAAAGMTRFFTRPSTLLPLTGAALVAHAAMAAARRRDLPSVAGAGLALGVSALASVWYVLPATTWYGVPGPSTWRAAAASVAAFGSEVLSVAAPIPPRPGPLLAAMAGVAGAAVIAASAVARNAGPLRALAPSFVLFAATAALGGEAHQALFAGLYLAAAGSVLLVASSVPAHMTVPVGSDQLRRRSAGVAAAIGAVSAMATAGVLAAPYLPGADATPVVALRPDQQDRGGRIDVVSPLSQLRANLVDQPDEELFRVRAPERAYWRLTALDEFDGQQWSIEAAYSPVNGQLPGEAGASESPSGEIDQEVTVVGLRSVWLPAAYRAVRLAGADDADFHPGTASLVVRPGAADGLVYRVRSRPSSHSLDALRRASPSSEADVPAQRAVPGPTRELRALAETIGSGSDGSAFGRARALQDFFNQGFVYDLNVSAGHGTAALESFLFGSRRGYSEQFASAYAVLARLMGLPARVAVGFTPGEPADSGTVVVRGRHAHAWPEVNLGNAGWVAFEPTPGRGAPGAEEYTGRPEAQDNQVLTPAAEVATPVPIDLPFPDGDETGASAPEREQPSFVTLGRLVFGAATVALPVVGIAAGLAAAVVMAKAARRRRRMARARAGGPAAQVRHAWVDVSEALAAAGTGMAPGETVLEYARRANPGPAAPGSSALPMVSLAVAAGAAYYGPAVLAQDLARQAEADAAAVRAALRSASSRRRRWLAAADPRPLLLSYRSPD